MKKITVILISLFYAVMISCATKPSEPPATPDPVLESSDLPAIPDPEPKPQPTPEPAPAVAEPAPEPVVVTPESAPVVEEPAPEPVVVTPEPAPVARTPIWAAEDIPMLIEQVTVIRQTLDSLEPGDRTAISTAFAKNTGTSYAVFIAQLDAFIAQPYSTSSQDIDTIVINIGALSQTFNAVSFPSTPQNQPDMWDDKDTATLIQAVDDILGILVDLSPGDYSGVANSFAAIAGTSLDSFVDQLIYFVADPNSANIEETDSILMGLASLAKVFDDMLGPIR
jgi:hypothetical protein